jgi:hypothetical protein
MEFLMVGCSGVGVCSVGILRDVEYIEEMCYDLSKLMAKMGYKDIESVRGAALGNFPTKDIVSKLYFTYEPYKAPCQEACPGASTCRSISRMCARANTSTRTTPSA